MGRMSILAEFSTMHSNLSTKRAVISRAELLTELAPAVVTPERKPKRRKTDDDGESGGGGSGKGGYSLNRGGSIPKNPNTWHPTLRAELGPAAKTDAK